MLGKNELEFEGGVSSRKLPNIPALALSPGSTNVTDRRSSTHRRICAISMLWVPSSSGSGPHAITGTPRPPAAPKAASSHRHTSSTHTRVRTRLAVPVQRVRNYSRNSRIPSSRVRNRISEPVHQSPSRAHQIMHCGTAMHMFEVCTGHRHQLAYVLYIILGQLTHAIKACYCT